MTEFVNVTPARFLAGANQYAASADMSHPDGVWNVDNSGIADYSEKANFFGKPEGLLQIIGECTGRRDDVGLDVAGGTNGVAIGELVMAGFLREGAVTNFTSLPSAEVRAERARAGVTHLAGSLLDVHTWRTMQAWQEKVAPQGLAVIMHRPYGALQTLSPEFYMGAVHWALNRLRPGGVLFTQIPQILDGGLIASDVPDLYAHLGAICDSIRKRSDLDAFYHSKPLPNRNFLGRKRYTPYSYVAFTKRSA